MKIKRILFLLLTISVGINVSALFYVLISGKPTYITCNENLRNMNNNLSNFQSEKGSTLKVKSKATTKDNIEKDKATSGEKKISVRHDEDYERLEEESKKLMESFLSDSLNLNWQEIELVFKILEEAEKNIDSFIEGNSQAYIEKYGDEYLSYMYGPEDYIYVGKARLSARKKIEKLIGPESYIRFYDYIQNFNQGRYSDSAIPIEF